MVTADMDLAFSAINASAVVGQKVVSPQSLLFILKTDLSGLAGWIPDLLRPEQVCHDQEQLWPGLHH